MNILGIHAGHNASACLLQDGRLLGAIQEERLTRRKNHAGFPARAIDALLEDAGLRPADVDRCAYLGGFRIDPEVFTDRRVTRRYFSNPPPRLSLATARKAARRLPPVDSLAGWVRRREHERDIVGRGIPQRSLRRVDHHEAHASAAYHGLGRYDAPVLVLTCDGRGGGLCASVSIGEEGRLRRIAAVSQEHSIGLIYSMTTLLLGMAPNEHEYKVMGLEPYASREDAQRVAERFRMFFSTDAGQPLGWRVTEAMKDTFWSYPHLRRELEFERFDAIAGGVQLWLEDFLVDWVRRCVQTTGVRRVALSGGVFMNVKANKRIMELDEVEDLFVFPSCGDETNAIGACYLVHAQERGVAELPPLSSFYLGRDFGEDAVAAAIEAHADGLHVRRPTDVSEATARLLAGGEVVARFAGREEFGARALGNRSILADPSRTDVVRTINSMIKNRDFWMPFACSLLAERADDYLVNPKGVAAPYMILTFDTTARRAEIAAGSHPYDGTVRPQILQREANPEYHDVLTHFARLTGIGGLLNTSLNLHGLPIVHTPEDALDVLKRSGLGTLAIGPYVVTKGAAALDLLESAP